MGHPIKYPPFEPADFCGRRNAHGLLYGDKPFISSSFVDLIDNDVDPNHMGFHEFFDRLDHFIFQFGLALCDPNCEVVKLLGVRFDPFFIEKKKNHQGGHSNPFVTVL
jgi:hypothetical protein